MNGGARRRTFRRMRTSHASSSFLFIFVFFLLSSPLLLSFVIPASANGEHKLQVERREEEEKQTPNLAERAIGVAAFSDRWNAIKTWAKLTWMNCIKTPDSQYDRSSSSPGEKMKEAAARSFEASKETVESAAATAAHVAEQVAQKTKKKLERTVSARDGRHEQEEL